MYYLHVLQIQELWGGVPRCAAGNPKKTSPLFGNRIKSRSKNVVSDFLDASGNKSKRNHDFSNVGPKTSISRLRAKSAVCSKTTACFEGVSWKPETNSWIAFEFCFTNAVSDSYDTPRNIMELPETPTTKGRTTDWRVFLSSKLNVIMSKVIPTSSRQYQLGYEEKDTMRKMLIFNSRNNQLWDEMCRAGNFSLSTCSLNWLDLLHHLHHTNSERIHDYM